MSVKVKKVDRQPKISSRAPPISGDSIGPSAITMPMVPRVEAASCGWKMSRTMARGRTIAAMMTAWMTRQIMKAVKPSDSAQPSEAPA